MDLNHFLRHFQRRRRQRRQPAIARPTAICAPSPPGGPASGAHRSEGGGRSDGRRSTCPRALGRGGLWRARERWRRWPRPAGRTPRSACRAPPPRGPVRPRQKDVGGSFRVYYRWPIHGHTLATLLDPWPHFGHTLATLWPHLFAPGCNKMLRIITDQSDQAVKSAAAGVFPRAFSPVRCCGHR